MKNKIAAFSFWFVFFTGLLTVPVSAGVVVENLRCEYLTNPLGIDTHQPRLSWVIRSDRNGMMQSAYQILVAGSAERLRQNEGDKWDSGKIASDQSIHIVYAGEPLTGGTRYWWKVRVWDQNGRSSAWSEAAWWEMGLNPAGRQAKWIGRKMQQCDSASQKMNPANYFRKPFRLSAAAQKGRVYISGLGYYELYINGKKVGDHLLAPNHTNYDRRQSRDLHEDRVGNMTTRVLYETYDITSSLLAGENVAAVCLGNGWYFQNDREDDRPFSYDSPRLIARFEISCEDGGKRTIVSDESWKTSDGPILHNGVYSGEIYDARLEQQGWNNTGFDDGKWQRVKLVRPPEGELQAQISPPDRVIKTIKPVVITQPEKGKWRYDLGQMISGWARLSIQGPRGARIKMRFIDDAGVSYGQEDIYILKGGEQENYEPRFTWHAFRYVDILDAPFPMTLENLEGRVVNTAVDSAGKFDCSNRLFNKIWQNYQWTQLGNLHGGVPSDCPHRERRGYTGDGQISAPAAIYGFDMASFYTKWLNDIGDAQNHVTGYVPNTAPFQDGGGGTAWGSAYVIIPWYMYLYYGDVSILEHHYAGMKKWISYLTQNRDDDGILIEHNLGEWVPPDVTVVPSALVSTAYFYHDLMLMTTVARVLHKSEDGDHFRNLSDQIRKAFHKKYFDDARQVYSVGRQGANVFPLGFGMVPEDLKQAVFSKLVQNIQIDAKGHFDTGMMATPLLLDVFTENGRPELAYTLMNQRDFPGFGYEIENGATTLWETWQGDVSRSHPMFGSVCRWFFKDLAGIAPDPESPGFKHVIIRPHPVSSLRSVRAVYKSMYGEIRSQWQTKNGDFYLHVSIPANTSASVFIPAGNAEPVSIEGSPAIFAGFKNRIACYKIGSGNYDFRSQNVGKILPKPMLAAPAISPADTLAFFSDTVTVRITGDEEDAVIRYTINGGEPDEHAQFYQRPFVVTENSIIKAKAFRKGYKPGFAKTSVITFIDPAKNGLDYEYFAGVWHKLPDFRRLQPVKSGKINDLSLQKIVLPANQFALIFSGKIQIPNPGEYTFFLVSNDGSRLFIDNKLVVDNDGAHGAIEKNGRITLSAGKHALKIPYFQAGGGMHLQLFFAGPGIHKQKVPASLFFFNRGG